jgi:CRP-like cAMP-binding protein
MRPTAEQLAAVPLFASLDEADRARLADWFEVRSVSAGTELAGEGASGYSFFVLQDGEATVTADGEQIRSLSSGDFFGEMALLGGGRRLATVTATSDGTVLVLCGTEFRRLQQELPEVAAELERVMRDRLGDTAPARSEA